MKTQSAYESVNRFVSTLRGNKNIDQRELADIAQLLTNKPTKSKSRKKANIKLS